eukprot:10014688-Ditylum_brightwellii.AAC.1
MENAGFVEVCLDSNNFDIGICGSSHLVAFALIAECQRYVFCTQQQINNDQLLQKCLLSLDLKNIFNRMSREKCRQILKDKFPHFVCLFDSLYKQANKVWVRKADGTIKEFLQYEGYAQGCPLS